MNSLTDQQLLRDYAENRSEAAFAELVRRHVDLIYSAALRMVCDTHLAEDVTQNTFIALAKNAAQLVNHPVLSGWLHRTARNLAANAVRTNVRRQMREQEAIAMNEQISTDVSWNEIAPHLDAALGELSESDRDVVMLRYFEKKSAVEMAGILGISDEAAQKRVSRAIEKLRELFSKKKITIGAGGLGILISTNAVQAAPVGLAVTISATAFTGTAATTSTIIATTTKTIAMTTLQKTIVTATVAVLAGAGVYEIHQAAQLRDQNQKLQQQQIQLAEQIQQLQSERDDATNRLADLLVENSRLNLNRTELLKLRGEVTQFQNEANDPTMKSAKIAAAKIKILKLYLEQNPNRSIPELQFVSEKDWANAVWNSDLKTADDAREALSKVRETAENIFLNEMMKAAFKKYLAANNDILPASLFQLEPYFDVPVTDAMLNRYQLLQSGTPDNSADLVKLTVYVDEDYDSSHGMSINGAWGSRFNTVSGAVQKAVDTFVKDNNGQKPSEASQITSYLKNPIDTATVQKYLNQIAAGVVPNRVP